MIRIAPDLPRAAVGEFRTALGELRSALRRFRIVLMIGIAVGAFRLAVEER